MSNSGRAERLLILIPAYNEAGAIWQVITEVRAAVPQADILVIDDGSTDHTAQVAQAAGAIVLRHPFNLGIGGTVQTGLKFAQQGLYDLVIRIDGDGQHDPVFIDTIHAALQADQADIVIGSRFMGTELTMTIPVLRRLGIRTFALAVSLLTGSKATDTTSGFFGMNQRAIAVLAAHMPQDYPEVESRVILHKSGIRVLELPTPMRARASGVSSIDSWQSVYYACKVLLAVLIAAIKEIPLVPQETTYAYSNGTTPNGRHR